MTTDHKEEEQLEDRGNVDESSCNSGDGTDQTVQSFLDVCDDDDDDDDENDYICSSCTKLWTRKPVQFSQHSDYASWMTEELWFDPRQGNLTFFFLQNLLVGCWDPQACYL
jgi:hypothetical protein